MSSNNQLVFIKRQNNQELPFTNSIKISEGSGIRHDYVKKVIKNHSLEIEELGKLSTENLSKVTGGRRNEVYQFNEQQSMFVITLLSNTKQVVRFKLDLVKEFSRMREFIEHRQSTEYIEVRKDSKLLQKSTMDVVKTFVDYAKENGSKSSDRYYIIYNKLINNILGIGSNDLDNINSKQLLMRSKILYYIAKNVSNDIKSEVYYKDIYKSCKYKLESMIDFIRV